MVFFLARASTMDVTPQEEEVREIRWLPLNDAVAALTFSSDRSILRRADEFLKRLK